jgi:hypothetical protein
VVTLIIQVLEKELVARQEIFQESANNIKVKLIDKVGIYLIAGVNLTASYYSKIGLK